MKPLLRTIRVEDQARLLAEDRHAENTDNEVGYPLPPEMENRPDAAELRAFIRNFHRIDNAKDRRAIMEAVFQAVGGEC